MNHPITGAVYPPHYYDAPGQHQPVSPDAPNPHNAATVARLRTCMELQRRRCTHNPVRIGMSPAESHEQLIHHIRQEVA